MNTTIKSLYLPSEESQLSSPLHQRRCLLGAVFRLYRGLVSWLRWSVRTRYGIPTELTADYKLSAEAKARSSWNLCYHEVIVKGSYLKYVFLRQRSVKFCFKPEAELDLNSLSRHIKLKAPVCTQVYVEWLPQRTSQFRHRFNPRLKWIDLNWNGLI